MKEVQKIKCSCGQETHLIELEDGLHYDVEKHGSDAPCNNRCFNCQGSLGLEPEPVEEPVKDVVDEQVDEQVDDTVDEQVDPAAAAAEAELAAMNGIQLRKRARELEIPVPFIITNEGIRNLIRAKSNGKKSE